MAPTQRAFYLDSASCSGCKACQVACKDWNGLQDGRLWRRVIEVEGGGWARSGAAWRHSVFAYNLSLSCGHCAQPACVEACPAAAIHKREDGLVLIEAGKCLGCEYCSWACPYGAPQYDPQAGVMGKCDFCAGRLEAGKEPACVAACPLRALHSGEQAGLEKRFGPLQPLYPLPDPALTRPALFLKPHPWAAARPGGNGAAQPLPALASGAGFAPSGGTSWKKHALVLFTLLMQAAAGLLAAGFSAALLLQLRLGPAAALAPLQAAARLALPLAGLGLLASLLHLGRPERAPRAAANLRRSWLSREVLAALLFCALCALFSGLQWARPAPGGAGLALAGAAAGAGLLLLTCMSLVYRLPAVPAWQAPAAPLFFFAGAFLLGALSLAALLAVQGGAGAAWLPSLLRALASAALFCLALLAPASRAWGRRLARLAGAAGERRGGLSFTRPLRLRQLLLGACALLLAGFLLLPASGPAPALLLWAALALALAAEACGRVLFYRALVVGRLGP